MDSVAQGAGFADGDYKTVAVTKHCSIIFILHVGATITFVQPASHLPVANHCNIEQATLQQISWIFRIYRV